MMDEEKLWMHNWLAAVNVNERINGQAKRGSLPGDEDNSDTYEETPESSVEDSDQEYDDYLYRMAGDFRRRGNPAGSVSGISLPKDTGSKPQKPPWFNDQPFQYHSRVCMVSLPGICLALFLGGEMLVFVLCVSGLVIYLLQTSGYQESALTIYNATWVFLTGYIFLMAFPLLWNSISHFVLVAGLTLHTAFTGAWLVLLFPRYRSENPSTAHHIEFLLFSVYPLTSVVLVSWLSVMMSSVFTASYILIAFSYAIIQWFLQSSPSSFHKAERQQKDSVFIITESEALALSVLHSLWPSLVFIAGMCYKKQFSLSTGVEFVCVISICGFICAITVSETLYQLYGTSQSRVRIAKVLFLVLAIVTAPVVLPNHGYHSSLLPYLPLVLIINSVFGYVIIKNKSQTVIFAMSAAVLATYTVMFTSLPWTAQLYISGQLDVRLIFILVYISFILSVQTVLAHVLFDIEDFGVCLFVQTVVFSSTQKILESHSFLPGPPCILVSVIAVYVIYRLYERQKVPARHACICVGFHCTSGLTSLTELLSVGAQDHSPVWNYTFLLCLLFLLTRYVLKEDVNIPSTKQVLLEMFLLGSVSVLNLPFWINQMLLIVLRYEPTFFENFSCVLVIQALSCFCVSTKYNFKRAKHFGVVLFLIAALIAFVQPSLKLSWENVVKWMIFSCILLVVLLTQITRFLRKSLMLSVIFAALIGLPLGISLSSLMFSAPDVFHNMFFSFVSVTQLLLAIFVWLERCDMEEMALKCLWVNVAGLAVCGGLELGLLETFNLLPVLLMMSTSLAAVMLKLHALRKQTLRLTKAGDLKLSRLPLIGNGCTLFAFLTSFYFSPLSLWNWGFVGSVLLLLLQEDCVLVGRADNPLVGPVCVMTGTLVVATCCHSMAWLPLDWTLRLSGCVEIIMTLITLPVFLVLCTVLYNGHFYLSDYYVALVAPLFSVLLLTGSSLYAYCLSVAGLSSSYWLLTEKLPLLR